MTLRRVAGATTAAFDSTRETVAVETPALFATSLILATVGEMLSDSGDQPTDHGDMSRHVEERSSPTSPK